MITLDAKRRNPFWSIPYRVPILTRNGRIGAARKQKTTRTQVLLEVMRELRKQCNLTQDQLAKSMGVKQAFISKYETGERRLDFLDLVAICEVMGISIVKFAEKFDVSRKTLK